MPRSKTSAARGYDRSHQAKRRWWKPKVDRGEVDCHAILCLEEQDGRSRRIEPGSAWDLGHTQDRTTWTGPEHMRCNRSEGGKRARAKERARTLPRSRNW